MACPRHDELSAYIDKVMTRGEHARFQQHLQACSICQLQLENLQVLRQNLSELPSLTLGFELASRLQDRLRHQSPPRQHHRRWSALWSGSGWISTGVTAGVALLSGIWLGGLLLGGGATSAANATAAVTMVRAFDPVPPGGLCAAAELCRLTKGMP